MESQDSIRIGKVIAMVRGDMQATNSDEVEASVARVLSQNPAWHVLAIRVPFPLGADSLEEEIFDLIISSPQFHGLHFHPTLNADCAKALLRKVATLMPNFQRFSLAVEMTESDAEMIMSILETVSSLKRLSIFVGWCSEQIARPLAKFLRKPSCSVQHFALTWEGDSSGTVSEAFLQEICDGIEQSKSLQVALVNDIPTDDAAMVGAKFAKAISNSASLFGLGTPPGVISTEFRNELAQTPRVKSFDVCFSCITARFNIPVFKLGRDLPWKPLLSQDVPLSFWPRILAKANKWNEYDSHKSHDALFFLLKEKNDVLLQNVRNRKIRKRKRHQMS